MLTIARPSRSLFLASALLVPLAPLAAAPAPCTVVQDFDPEGQERLRITGTISRQILTVTAQVNLATTVALDCNADGDLGDPGDVQDDLGRFSTIDVSLGGADTITLQLAPGTHTTSTVFNPQITLGPGTNNVTIGVAGPATFLQGTFLVEVFGNSGADTLSVTTPELVQGRYSLLADLGAGSDVVAINQGGGGSTGGVAGSDFRVAVNLGTGTTNTFTFQQQPAPGAGVLDSLFAVSVEGGTGRDSVFVDVNGGFFQGSTAEFAADLGAGNDTFEATVDLASLLLVALPGNLRGSLHFDVEGGAGTNALAVTRNGTATTGGFTLFNRALLDVRLKGGPGADAILVDLAGALLFGGSDQGTVRVRLDGGAGNDRLALLGNVDATTAFVPVHDVVVTGGPGKDVVDVDWENDPDFSDDPTSYGPHGRIVIDGMTGGDTCTLAGANRATMRGCEQ